VDAAGAGGVLGQLGRRAIDDLLVGNRVDEAGAEQRCSIALGDDVRARRNDLGAIGGDPSLLQDRAAKRGERIEDPGGDEAETGDGLGTLTSQRRIPMAAVTTGLGVERRAEALLRE
jgi:hypothetical protein